MSDEVLRCFTEEDREALYALFCPQAQARPELDGELDEALAFFTCDSVIGSEPTVIDTSTFSADDNQSKVWYVIPEIPYIRVLFDADGNPSTPAETRYFGLQYTWYIENDEDPSLEGLQCITVELLNVGSIQVGEEKGWGAGEVQQ